MVWACKRSSERSVCLIAVCIFINLKIQAQVFAIHFYSNSSRLSEQAVRSIDSVLMQLQYKPSRYTVTFTGHSDSSGTFASNERMSLKRAREVYNYFKAKKFAGRNMTCNSKAFTKPVSDNTTEHKKYLNRRVEIKIALLPPSLGGLTLKYDRYQFAAATGTVIGYPTGTKIKIAPNSFVDAKGNPVTGTVELVYKEFRTISDFLLAGVAMQYTHNNEVIPFNSAGMFKILAFKDGAPVFLRKGQDVKLDFPLEKNLPNLNFYNLDTVKNKWTEIKKLRDSTGQPAGFDDDDQADYEGLYDEALYRTPCGPINYNMPCAVSDCAALDALIEKGLKFANSDIDFSPWFGYDNDTLFSRKYLDTLEFIRKKTEIKQLQINAIAAREKRSQHVYVLQKNSEHKNSFQVICRRGTENELNVLKNPLWSFAGKKQNNIPDSMYRSKWQSCKISPVSDKLFKIELSNAGEDHYVLTGLKMKLGSNVKGRKKTAVQKRLFEMYDSTIAVHENKMNRLDERTDSIKLEKNKLHVLSDALTNEMKKFGGDSVCCFWYQNQPYMSRRESLLRPRESWLFYFSNHKSEMLSRYVNLKASRDQRCKEMEVARTKINEERRRNWEAGAEARLQARIIAKKLQAPLELLSITEFGFFNCDQLKRLSFPIVNMSARFNGPDKKPLAIKMVYVVHDDINGMMFYDGHNSTNSISFQYSTAAKTVLIAFDTSYDSYILRSERFATLDAVGKTCNYTFGLIPIGSLKNQKALEKFIK